jgi:DNA-binding LacI/PurR family transcriptional regulator
MLDPQQVREVAARAICTANTVRKVYSHPGKVRVASILRVAQAAKSLGYEPPSGPVRHVAPITPANNGNAR